MRATFRRTGFWLWALTALFALLLGACGSANANATPTLGVEAIFTSAYQTFSAQAATQLALTPPTDTPAPTPFPTLPPPSPFATSSFASPTLSSGGLSGCDNSGYVADDTIPDGTVIAAGKAFVKTWLLQNTGTCAWGTDYKLSFDSGEQMGGADAFVPVPVPSGNQTKLSVKLTAPTAAGRYTGKWRMKNASSQPFGSFITVVIRVGDGGSAAPTSASGMVTISGNGGRPQVVIDYEGTGSKVTGQVTADGNGNYSFTVPSGWSGTVTPSKKKYQFTPASIPYSNVISDLSGQDYTAQ